ncbi:MAG: ATP-binding protein [Pseudomonadota bacterium]
MIDDLVAAAIHDAKNALLALDVQLAAAECRPASADFRGARGQVSRIATDLARLLTLYRAQQGRLHVHIDDRDLSDFLDDTVAELSPLPAHLTLQVNRDSAMQLGAWAFDAYLVRLVLLDALRNALRHAAAWITLTVERLDGEGIAFVVSDDGDGFPAAILSGAADASGDGSTGLGLSFAQLIATSHVTPDGRHGRLELKNTPGACLTLILP